MVQLMDLDLASTLDPQTKFVEIRDQLHNVRTVQVNVPRGVQSGMQMRFPGHGDHTNKSVPAGDLYVELGATPAGDYLAGGTAFNEVLVVDVTAGSQDVDRQRRGRGRGNGAIGCPGASRRPRTE